MNEWINQNKSNWDQLTPIHATSDFYDVESALNGGSTLTQLELDLVGPANARQLLHLQCHFGLDTLSWARLGFQATGVDFSDAAIEQAKSLAKTAELNASFVQSDVQHLAELGDFDVVVTSYGVVCWLQDLAGWAEGILRNLKPGGQFTVIDFHPILEAMYPDKMTGAKGYFGGGETHSVVTHGTYADRDADIVLTEHRWQHTIGQLVTALAAAGLNIDSVVEYPYVPFPLFDDLEQDEVGNWRQPAEVPSIPYLFSITASKPE